MDYQYFKNISHQLFNQCIVRASTKNFLCVILFDLQSNKMWEYYYPYFMAEETEA